MMARLIELNCMSLVDIEEIRITIAHTPMAIYLKLINVIAEIGCAVCIYETEFIHSFICAIVGIFI